MSDRLNRIEERVAHLERTVEELSAVVARQDREIAAQARRVEMLLMREAAREGTEGAPPSDERPPHW